MAITINVAANPTATCLPCDIECLLDSVRLISIDSRWTAIGGGCYHGMSSGYKTEEGCRTQHFMGLRFCGCGTSAGCFGFAQ
jgi:hypothetical protein